MVRTLTTLLITICITATLGYAHGDATHLTGTITQIEGDHVQIKDQAGKLVIVMLQKTTKFLKSAKAATKADLKVGTRVLIDAKMDDKMNNGNSETCSAGEGKITASAANF
jgi:hypothetical protein